MCKGDFRLGTACGKCSRCIAAEALRPENQRIYPVGTERNWQAELDAQRLRADTAEAELRTERLRADAAVGDANDAERSLAGAEQRIAELKCALENLIDAYSKPDDRICCSGHDCGCMGATNHQQAEHYAKEALNQKSEGESQ